MKIMVNKLLYKASEGVRVGLIVANVIKNGIGE